MNPNDKKTETTNEKKPTHNVKDTSGHPVAEVATEEAEKIAGGNEEFFHQASGDIRPLK